MKRKKIIRLASICLTIVTVIGFSASAKQTINSKKKQIEKNKMTISALRKENKEIEYNKNIIHTQVADLDKKIEISNKRILSYNSSIRLTASSIITTKNEILQLEKEIHEKKRALEKKIVEEYINTKYDSYVAIILSSNNISEITARFKYIDSITKSDISSIQDIVQKEDKLNQYKIKLMHDKNSLSKLKIEQESSKNELSDIKTQKKNRIQQLTHQQEEIKNKIVDILEISKQLEKEIEKMIRDAARNNKKVYIKNSKGFIMPCSGVLSSPFGYRIHPITHKKALHTGIDIANNSGTPVYASESGVVVHSSPLGGYGNAVIISHGRGLSTLYGHFSKIYVHNGQIVKKGQKIGSMGSTGRSTGPHTHFEIRKNGSPVNPFNYVH